LRITEINHAMLAFGPSCASSDARTRSILRPFTVWIGKTRVAQKDANGFPEDDQMLAAVQKTLTRRSENS
jgi:hypothetical protein